MRTLIKGMAAGAAALGAMVFAASPAAADAPYWEPVNTTSAWHCGSTASHTANSRVQFQVCAVHGAAGYSQAVLVVVNNSSSAVQIEGYVELESASYLIPDSCDRSSLVAGARTGCVGRTVKTGNETLTASALLKVNGEWDNAPRKVWTP